MTDLKLKYQIVADAARAKAEIRSFDDVLNGVGGRIGGLGTGAVIGAAGIAAIGAASITAGVALFNLTKNAAEFGSEIFDASKKTGLGAEALSAMKFAADQSGTSLEAITGGIAKFSKTVGAAADDTKKATKFLEDFGITPQEAINDLDGSLGKVFKKIIDAPPGIERMTLAQKAFGRSGADLLPFLDSFDGDLGKLIQKAKDLGVTIDDDAARAADEFGDQLDTLNAQLAGVGRTIGMELMPVFSDMASDISDWAVRNKDEIKDWGTNFADTIAGAVTNLRWFGNELSEFKAIQQAGGLISSATSTFGYAPILGPFSGGLIDFLIASGNTGAATRNSARGFGWAGVAPSTSRPTVDSSNLTDLAKGGGGGRSPKSTAVGSAMKRWFEEELGAFVTSDARAVGRNVAGTSRVSKHSIRPYEAVDVRTRDRSVGDIFTITARAIEHGYRLVDERNKKGSPHQHYEAKSMKASSFLGAGMYGGEQQLAYLKSLDAARIGKASGAGGLDKFKEGEVDNQKKANEETLDVIREGIDQEIELYEARAETKLSILDRDVAAGIRTEEQAADARLQLEEDVLNFKIQKLEEYSELTEVDARERGKIAQQIALTLEQIEQKRAQRDKERHDAEQKRLAEKRKSWNAYVQAIIAATEAQDEADAKAGRRRYESGTVMGGTGIGGSIAQGMGADLVPMFDEATNAMLTFQERLALVGADMNNFVGNAIGGLIQGLAAMGAAWLVSGEFSAKAALQMAAGVALGIAMQAGVKAIFEFAEAAAAAARYDFVAASMHSAAAGLYLKTAIIAGAIGVGLGLIGRAVGGGGGASASGGGSSSSSGGNTEREVRPYSRESEDVYISGRRADPATRALARAVEKLERKLSGMSAGDVLVVGSRQKRGFIANQFSEDVKNNSGLGTKAAKSMGMR